MAQPPEYVRQYDFAAFQASNPTTPLPAAQIELEFNEIKDTLDALNTNIALIQRDDGALRNLSVGLDQLKPEVVLGVPTDWVTGTAYEAKDVVWQAGVLYVCNTAHTSGVFATDLAAVKWTAYLDYADPLADAAGYAADAAASALDASGFATAADASADAAAASALAADASADAAAAAISAIAIPWTVAQGGTNATTPAGARTNLGISAAGDAIVTAATAALQRAALGSTTVGDAVFIAASAAAARAALSLGDAALATIGTSGDTIPKNNTANIFSAAQSITLSAAGIGFTMTSTDAGASAGPAILLDRNSASPAANDVIGATYYRGRDSGGNATDYVTAQVTITDPTDGSEDALFQINALVAGVNTEQIRIGNNQVRVPAGVVGTPGLGIGANGAGFYESSANIIACATGGAARWSTNSTQSIDALYPIVVADGSNTAPAFSFRNDTNTGVYRIGNDNLGIVAGGTAYLDISTARTMAWHPLVYGGFSAPVGTKDIGFRGAPLIGDAASNAAISFALVDSGCTAYHDEVTARTWTIPANSSVAFPIGTVIIIDNTGNSGAAGSITLSITTDTLRRGDGVAGTGSRTVAASSVAAIRKTKSTEWVITGAFT